MKMLSIFAVAAVAALAGCAGAPPPKAAPEQKGTIEIRLASYIEEPGFIRVTPVVNIMEGEPAFVAPVAALDETDIVSARALAVGRVPKEGEDHNAAVEPTGEYCLALQFNSKGLSRISKFTRENLNGYMALIIDGKVEVMVPILAPVAQKNIVIGATYPSPEYVYDLAARMNARAKGQ